MEDNLIKSINVKKDMEFSYGLMVLNMKDCGRMVKQMVMVVLY